MKGGGPLGGLLKQAQQLQEQMQKAQQVLAKLEVTGESGGGLVKVTLTGKHEAKRVTIDPAALADRELLEDLLITAINDAVQQVEKMTQDKLSGATGGMALPPGLKLPWG
jgi:DNA-binding YbaB/EbfC family protein